VLGFPGVGVEGLWRRGYQHTVRRTGDEKEKRRRKRRRTSALHHDRKAKGHESGTMRRMGPAPNLVLVYMK
jgi:hypothetical protein